ncbi:MAG: VPLPA-CTERM sorting domain-containing protein [Roseobacter sp.]
MNIKLTMKTIAAALLLGSAANAATITFETDESGFVQTPSGSTGGAATGPFQSGLNGVTFTIDADTFGLRYGSLSLNGESRIAITQNNEGLGVNNFNPDGSGEIDGSGSNDILVFQFSSAVRLTEIIFESVSNNDDFVFYTPGQSPNAAQFDILNPIPFDIDGDEGLFATNFTGTTFGIGAFGDNDDFRVSKLTVAAVPLPAGLPLLMAGLGAFGFMSRRKKKA